MPEHFHALIGIGESNSDLGKICGAFKSLTTRIYWKYGKGTLWQRSFYDHIVRNETDFTECVKYIKNNPAGSALPAIKHSTIGDIEFIMPSKHVLEDFREFAQKIERKVLGNNSEIKSLSHISEELLPKLML